LDPLIDVHRPRCIISGNCLPTAFHKASAHPKSGRQDSELPKSNFTKALHGEQLVFEIRAPRPQGGRTRVPKTSKCLQRDQRKIVPFYAVRVCFVAQKPFGGVARAECTYLARPKPSNSSKEEGETLRERALNFGANAPPKFIGSDLLQTPSNSSKEKGETQRERALNFGTNVCR